MRSRNISRYTEKDDAELAWADIRREIQYRVQLAATTWRIRKLNEILPKKQKEFEEALNRGVILELDSGDISWLEDVLSLDEPG